MTPHCLHKHWKLLSNADGSHAELNDLSSDPYEAKDLHASKPEVAERLLGLIEQWKSERPGRPTGPVFSRERQTQRP